MTKSTGTGRGGPRPGAGRPNGIHTPFTKDTIERLRARIQSEAVIQTLNDVATGKIAAKSTRVKAAEILLNKIMPSLISAETKNETTHSYVARVPEKSASVDQWAAQHDDEPMATPPRPLQ